MLDCQITCIFENRATPIPRTKPPRSTASGLFPAIALTSLQGYCLPNYEVASRNSKNLQPALVSKYTSFCSPNLVSVGVNTEMNKRQVRDLPQSGSAVRILIGQDRIVFLPRNVEAASGTHPGSYPMGTEGSLPDVQLTRRDGNCPLHLVPRLRMGGVLTPPHLPVSRRGQEQIYPLYKFIPGRGSNAGTGKTFPPKPSWPALGPRKPLIQQVLGFIPGIKAAGAWRLPHTSRSVKIKNERSNTSTHPI